MFIVRNIELICLLSEATFGEGPRCLQSPGTCYMFTVRGIELICLLSKATSGEGVHGLQSSRACSMFTIQNIELICLLSEALYGEGSRVSNLQEHVLYLLSKAYKHLLTVRSNFWRWATRSQIFGNMVYTYFSKHRTHFE